VTHAAVSANADKTKIPMLIFITGPFQLQFHILLQAQPLHKRDYYDFAPREASTLLLGRLSGGVGRLRALEQCEGDTEAGYQRRGAQRQIDECFFFASV
jgi:hypothetical protein